MIKSSLISRAPYFKKDIQFKLLSIKVPDSGKTLGGNILGDAS